MLVTVRAAQSVRRGQREAHLTLALPSVRRWRIARPEPNGLGSRSSTASAAATLFRRTSADIRMMGMAAVAGVARSQRQTSTPSIRGIVRSSKIHVGVRVVGEA